MTDAAPQNFNATDQGAEKSVQNNPEEAKQDGVIAGKPNQETFGQANAIKHQNDRTLSEPDMIAIGKDETVAEHKARVARIQANRCSFFDSAEESNGSAEETGTVIDYQPAKTGKQSYVLGMDYEEGDNRSIYEKLADFGKAGAARATDPEGQRAYIQGQLDKIIGIGEGLNIAKDSTKAAVVNGWTAMTDGTVATLLSKPNAINDPLFRAVGGALDAMAQDPNAVNHALEKVGIIIMSASARYSEADNREKGHAIGEAMFAMVNPEGSPEAGQAALKVADAVATQVDKAVMEQLQQQIKQIGEWSTSAPEKAQQARQFLYDYTKTLGLSTQEMELAGIPKGYFDSMKAGEKGDNYVSMSKADDLRHNPKEVDPHLSGKGGDWQIIDERPSPDVVRQTDKYSCSSACGEMLTNGELKQAELIKKINAPCSAEALADALGQPWKGKQVTEASLDSLLNQNSSWAAELREIQPSNQYKRLELAHTVVVDGLDGQGNIMIRDPADGTRYEMTRENFLLHWNLTAVYRSKV